MNIYYQDLPKTRKEGARLYGWCYRTFRELLIERVQLGHSGLLKPRDWEKIIRELGDPRK
jgi:hypothetical protein